MDYGEFLEKYGTHGAPIIIDFLAELAKHQPITEQQSALLKELSADLQGAINSLQEDP